MAIIAEVASHLDLSSRSITELQSRGILPRAKKGALNLDECRVAYLRHLRAVASKHESADGELDLVQERARLAKEQADAKALDNQERRKELLPARDVHEAITGLFSRIRARLLSIPAKAAPIVASMSDPTACKAAVNKLILESLNEMEKFQIEDASDEDE